MNYAQLLKAIAAANRHLLGRAAAAANQALVLRNWLIGAYLIEYEQEGKDRAKYGVRLLERLAADLACRGLKGLEIRNLRNCRLLYQRYPQIRQTLSAEFNLAVPLRAIRQTPSAEFTRGEICAAVVRKSFARQPSPLSVNLVLRLSWSKLIELIPIDDPSKRAFYENECLKGNWSVRQLQRQIGSLLYERTGLSTNKRAVIKRAHRQEPQQTIEDLIRDPYVLEFTGLAERSEFHETDLERALLDDLQAFLLELGTGFCFEARQFRVTVGNDHDYLDLLFYHRVLRCHVLLDLKTRAFKHADAGQMNYYVNYFKKRVMTGGDNPPVGIILCSDRDTTKVEFATAGMDNKLFVSRYLVGLPTTKQLSRFLEQDRARYEALAAQKRPLPLSLPKKIKTKGAARGQTRGGK
jgi:predicted nuclease of restriction endonuclease-like (RecB) superfamily